MRDSLMANCYGIVAKSGKRKSLFLKHFSTLKHALMANLQCTNRHNAQRSGNA